MEAILMITGLIVTAFANAEMDTIAHRPKQALIFKDFIGMFFSARKLNEFGLKWYLANNWKGHTWMRKTIFSFTLDGWHFWKAIRVYAYSFAFAEVLRLAYFQVFGWQVSLLAAFVVYAINGILFETFYHDYLGV